MGMRRGRSIQGVRGQVETPQSERAVALSDEDGLTLVVDKDVSIVEVGAAACIAELADGQETVVLEFGEKVNLSSSMGKSSSPSWVDRMIVPLAHSTGSGVMDFFLFLIGRSSKPKLAVHAESKVAVTVGAPGGCAMKLVRDEIEVGPLS